VAELLENATVFSPPHTAVQVIGERVANGFTLEIHDRGLGMAAEALLDANLRLAETPEFELSDTDRLGLFVVSRLAQRQNVRVSLQPSPYGGTTAVVFIPDALLTDDVPDTNGIGFRLDRALPSKEGRTEEDRTSALSQVPVHLPGLPASVLDGPVELEAPVDLDALSGFPEALDDEDSEQGGLFRSRRSIAGVPVEQHQQAIEGRGEPARSGDDEHPGTPVPLPRRRAPKLVSSHGRPVTRTRSRRGEAHEEPVEALEPRDGLGPVELLGVGERESAKPLAARRAERTESSSVRRGSERTEISARRGDDRSELPGLRETPALPQRTRRAPTTSGAGETTPRSDAQTEGAESGASPLPRRVRQANLAPQLKDGPERRAEHDRARSGSGANPADRDADEVRNRMASLQRGWQRGREENAVGDEAGDGTAPGTTRGDGR
jgi:hypothetical protein